ncbi:uncharacterized protein [Ptychodera flava]|uniref:uncharacterized protein isoform X2 n=1 Tax=Ptychodera flava TaxID=63121 RepID=UPI003969C442
MAEAPGVSTINPLNILFLDLAKGLTENDVNEIKNLLRGDQVSEQEMDKLKSAIDVFHHLKNRGDIGISNLILLKGLFSHIHKETLNTKVTEFQRKNASITDPVDNTSTSVSSGGNDLNQTSSEGMTGKINVVMDENERQRQELDIEERRVKLDLQKKLLELVQKYINSVPENDNAKLGECMDKLKEFGADLNEVKRGSLFFILSFITEQDLDCFWQKYKDGTVDKALTSILIPTDIRDKALKAGITIRIKLEIDDKEYEEVKQKMHEMAAVSSACRETLRQVTKCDKWEAFVMDQVQDKQQARTLLEQSKFDPVVDALREEEFFFLSLVSFWFENSTFPPTVTKATEHALIHNAEMFCKENNMKVENLRDIVKARFNDVGKCLYEHITEENVGILNPSWIDKSISNLESHFFGLLTKSEDCYTFQSKYLYTYIIAAYISTLLHCRQIIFQYYSRMTEQRFCKPTCHIVSHMSLGFWVRKHHIS